MRNRLLKSKILVKNKNDDFDRDMENKTIHITTPRAAKQNPL